MSAFSRDPWRLVIAVAMGNYIGAQPASVAAFLLGGVVDGHGFSELQAGVLSTAEIGGAAGAALLIAPFMARLSRVRVALLGGCLALLAHGGSALLESFESLVALRLGAGIAAGLVLAAANAAAAAAANPDRLYGFAIAGLLALMGTLTPGISWVIASAGISTGYVSLGILVLLALPTFRWLDVADRETPHEQVPAPIPRREFSILLAVMLLFALGASPMWAFLERVGVSIGLASDRVGLWYGVSHIASMVGALLTGFLAPRWGRTRPMICLLLFLGLSCTSIGYAWSEASFVCATLLYALSFNSLYAFVLATAAALDPAGRATPAALGVFMVSYAFGPAVGGAIATHAAYTAIALFGLGVLTAAALLVGLLPFSRQSSKGSAS